MPPLPMVVPADHNSVMVPGVDSEVISKDLSTVVSARKVEGSVLGAWALQDAWVHLHGERHEDPRGFTREERRIDRVHLPTQAVHNLRLVYTVGTPADHKAVVAQLGPVEDHGGPPRFRFLPHLLEDPAALAALQEKLQAVACLDPEFWWDSVRVLLREEAALEAASLLEEGALQPPTYAPLSNSSVSPTGRRASITAGGSSEKTAKTPHQTASLAPLPTGEKAPYAAQQSATAFVHTTQRYGCVSTAHTLTGSPAPARLPWGTSPESTSSDATCLCPAPSGASYPCVSTHAVTAGMPSPSNSTPAPPRRQTKKLSPLVLAAAPPLPWPARASAKSPSRMLRRM